MLQNPPPLVLLEPVGSLDVLLEGAGVEGFSVGPELGLGESPLDGGDPSLSALGKHTNEFAETSGGAGIQTIWSVVLEKTG